MKGIDELYIYVGYHKAFILTEGEKVRHAKQLWFVTHNKKTYKVISIEYWYWNGMLLILGIGLLSNHNPPGPIQPLKDMQIFVFYHCTVAVHFSTAL